MPYIIENNYILEAVDRRLIVVRIDSKMGSRLFIKDPYYSDAEIVLLDAKKGDILEREEVEYTFLYRPSLKGPITLKELKDFAANGDDYIHEVNVNFKEKNEIVTFPEVRLVLNQYREEDSEEFFETVAQLYPTFGKYYKMYKETLAGYPERHRLWSEYWIGFTDSEENVVYMSRNNDDTIKLEYIGEWCGDGESDEEFICESNIFNELEINTIDQIRDKASFLEGLKKLFTDPSKSDFANPIRLNEATFDFQDLSRKINTLEPSFGVSAGELDAVLGEFKIL